MKTWIKGTLIGMIIAFLTIFIDYDFFINFGGPETPFTDFIVKLSGISVSVSQRLWVGLIILLIILGVIGGLIGFIIQKIKK